MNSIVLVTALLALVGSSLQDTIVDTSAACSQITQPAPNGASGLIAELLGKPYKPADQYTQGVAIGAFNNYPNANPGTVTGFPGNLHWLAIFIGNKDCDCMFIDVPSPGSNVRCTKNGYGSEMVYKYDY